MYLGAEFEVVRSWDTKEKNTKPRRCNILQGVLFMIKTCRFFFVRRSLWMERWVRVSEPSARRGVERG